MAYVSEAPKVVSRDEWNKAREALLVKEKELTRAHDRVNAERRQLPMVRIEKDYTLEGPNGKIAFRDLFDGRDQLIVRHMMFHPDDEIPCTHCSYFAGAIEFPHKQLKQENTTVIAVSRAPYKKLETMSKRMDWNFPWYSSYDTSFNQDFGVTVDDGELPATSVFLKTGEDIYQTYWTSGRGLERFMTLGFVDATPLGRQEKWEEPKGRATPIRTSNVFPYPDTWV